MLDNHVLAQISNNMKERGWQDLADMVLKLSSTSGTGSDGGGSSSPSVQFVIPSEPVRISLSSTEPVTMTDLTAAVAWVHPVLSDGIFLWDGTRWLAYPLPNVLPVLPASGAANQGFDVFLRWDGTQVVSDVVNWASTTVRAVELELLDGVYVLTADNTWRYIGSGRYETGGFADTVTKRWIWNYYNRTERPARTVNSGTWTGNSTLRPFANSSAYNVSIFRGIVDSIDTIDCRVAGSVDLAPSGALGAPLPLNVVCGIGVDSTSINGANVHLDGYWDIQIPVEIVMTMQASAYLQHASTGETVYYALSSTNTSPHSGEEFTEGPGAMFVRAFQ